MNLRIREKERELRQGSWERRPPGGDALFNFLNGVRSALGLDPIPGHGDKATLEERRLLHRFWMGEQVPEDGRRAKLGSGM